VFQSAGQVSNRTTTVYTWRSSGLGVHPSVNPLPHTGSSVSDMSEPSTSQPSTGSHQIPEELALEVRRLAHDLSNSLEIIVQTSYLLSMAELKPPADDWLRMLDSGVQKALGINQELRDYIKKHTPR